MSKKWRSATFLSFTGFASRIRSRAAKPAKNENLWVFIRSDAHVVRAGLNIRGCGPLSTPGFIDRLRKVSPFFKFIFFVRLFFSLCFFLLFFSPEKKRERMYIHPSLSTSLPLHPLPQLPFYPAKGVVHALYGAGHGLGYLAVGHTLKEKLRYPLFKRGKAGIYHPS